MEKIIFFFLTSFFIHSSIQAKTLDFINAKDGIFYRNNAPYFYMGTNFWQGMNLGSENKDQLLLELDQLKKNGVTQLRILALSEGPESEPYRVVPAVQARPGVLNEELLIGLDFLLSEMGKRDMTAVVCLSNFWPWSGGFAQWVSWFEKSSIPYPPPHPGGSWSTFQEYSSRFYVIPTAIKAQQESVRKIVSRVNTITQIAYKNDPTIMAWELANEPRGGTRRKEFLAWIRSSAKLIKSIDPNHLVTTGSEGETMNAASAGNNFIEDHAIPEIDYATIHIWVENWGVYNPQDIFTLNRSIDFLKNYIARHVQLSKTFKKPVVLEEFGMARDNRSMDPTSLTKQRDLYYSATFQHVNLAMQKKELAGVNFWAWSGMARPSRPYGGLWRAGDDLLGDPPHEEQGWYGVYSSDTSTLETIKFFAKKYNFLGKKK